MSASTSLLFVYGTLMRGYPLHRLLEGRSRYVGDGTVGGRLVDLGAYPGAAPDVNARVAGEVYDVDAAAWSALDSAEGPQYHRGEVGVLMRDGAEQVAFIYWYRGQLRGVPIPGGDYRAHAPARSIHHDPRS